MSDSPIAGAMSDEYYTTKAIRMADGKATALTAIIVRIDGEYNEALYDIGFHGRDLIFTVTNGSEYWTQHDTRKLFRRAELLNDDSIFREFLTDIHDFEWKFELLRDGHKYYPPDMREIMDERQT